MPAGGADGRTALPAPVPGARSRCLLLRSRWGAGAAWAQFAAVRRCRPPRTRARPAGNGLRSGRKVLRRKLVGPTLVGWYPQDMTKTDPLLLNLDAER